MDYQAFKEAFRAEFNAKFDKKSAVLRATMSSEEYNIHRALCFEWYLSGFFDALADADVAELAEAKGATVEKKGKKNG